MIAVGLDSDVKKALDMLLLLNKHGADFLTYPQHLKAVAYRGILSHVHTVIIWLQDGGFPSLE